MKYFVSRLLNLGCGRRLHPDWVNADLKAWRRGMVECDLSRTLPFADGCFDVVYHSHLLEHLAPAAARRFLDECRRVLRPGGILRVVVPDLEQIARLYLRYLDGALTGERGAAERYRWMVIELLDQLVRHRSGGEMLRYWRQNPMPAEEFVVERVGSEVLGMLEGLRRQGGEGRVVEEEAPDAAAVGAFRLSGEAHQWMYDRFSLSELLREAGFAEVQIVTADRSRIPDFNGYLLDIEADGRVRKPDSLFVEALRPEGARP